jgi:hypothetical protein
MEPSRCHVLVCEGYMVAVAVGQSRDLLDDLGALRTLPSTHDAKDTVLCIVRTQDAVVV